MFTFRKRIEPGMAFIRKDVIKRDPGEMYLIIGVNLNDRLMHILLHRERVATHHVVPVIDGNFSIETLFSSAFFYCL